MSFSRFQSFVRKVFKTNGVEVGDLNMNSGLRLGTVVEEGTVTSTCTGGNCGATGEGLCALKFDGNGEVVNVLRCLSAPFDACTYGDLEIEVVGAAFTSCLPVDGEDDDFKS